MYIVKNTIYADAGCILRQGGIRAFRLPATDGVNEDRYDDAEPVIADGYIAFGDVSIGYAHSDYGGIKADLVKKQYSNDDQIAIILNREDSDADRLRYDKMQEWREWSGRIARIITESKPIAQITR